MARIIIPADFASQRTLLTNIIAQNNELGTSSPLTAYLPQQNIVLADDVTAGDTAQTHETNRAMLSKQSENFSELRDNGFELPWKHLTGIAQFLKQFNKGNIKELGNWGLPVMESGKIKYPPAFEKRVEIFNAVIAKHKELGADSPLTPYITENEIDVDADSSAVVQAAKNHAKFIAAAAESENETQLRNNAWNPVVQHLRSIGGFLIELYVNNPKALGKWGFVVDDSPQKPKLRTTKLKLGGKITNKSVVIGSVVTNTGDGDLHLYKGSSITGTPVILHKGEQFGIQKGWSSITVVNPSTFIEGKFTTVVSSS